jgi:hypothetical protein
MINYQKQQITFRPNDQLVANRENVGKHLTSSRGGENINKNKNKTKTKTKTKPKTMSFFLSENES